MLIYILGSSGFAVYWYIGASINAVQSTEPALFCHGWVSCWMFSLPVWAELVYLSFSWLIKLQKCCKTSGAFWEMSLCLEAALMLLLAFISLKSCFKMWRATLNRRACLKMGFEKSKNYTMICDTFMHASSCISSNINISHSSYILLCLWGNLLLLLVNMGCQNEFLQCIYIEPCIWSYPVDLTPPVWWISCIFGLFLAADVSFSSWCLGSNAYSPSVLVDKKHLRYVS